MMQRKGSYYQKPGNGSKPRTPPATGITGVLTNLFRIIQFDMGINGYRWNSLMEEYLRFEIAGAERRRREKDSRNTDPNKPPIDHVELNRRDRTSIRGNLHKEFNRSSMTWKVFCKTLMFLQWKRFQIVIIAEHRNGMQSEHRGPTVTLDYNQGLDELNEGDDDQHEPSQPLGPLTSSSITIPEDTPADQA